MMHIKEYDGYFNESNKEVFAKKKTKSGKSSCKKGSGGKKSKPKK